MVKEAKVRIGLQSRRWRRRRRRRRRILHAVRTRFSSMHNPHVSLLDHTSEV